MSCEKCDKQRRIALKFHQEGWPCDICNDTAVDHLGRPCRHCSVPENVEAST